MIGIDARSDVSGYGIGNESGIVDGNGEVDFGFENDVCGRLLRYHDSLEQCVLDECKEILENIPGFPHLKHSRSSGLPPLRPRSVSCRGFLNC